MYTIKILLCQNHDFTFYPFELNFESTDQKLTFFFWITPSKEQLFLIWLNFFVTVHFRKLFCSYFAVMHVVQVSQPSPTFLPQLFNNNNPAPDPNFQNSRPHFSPPSPYFFYPVGRPVSGAIYLTVLYVYIHLALSLQ